MMTKTSGLTYNPPDKHELPGQVCEQWHQCYSCLLRVRPETDIRQFHKCTWWVQPWPRLPPGTWHRRRRCKTILGQTDLLEGFPGPAHLGTNTHNKKTNNSQLDEVQKGSWLNGKGSSPLLYCIDKILGLVFFRTSWNNYVFGCDANKRKQQNKRKVNKYYYNPFFLLFSFVRVPTSILRFFTVLLVGTSRYHFFLSIL